MRARCCRHIRTVLGVRTWYSKYVAAAARAAAAHQPLASHSRRRPPVATTLPAGGHYTATRSWHRRHPQPMMASMASMLVAGAALLSLLAPVSAQMVHGTRLPKWKPTYQMNSSTVRAQCRPSLIVACIDLSRHRQPVPPRRRDSERSTRCICARSS